MRKFNIKIGTDIQCDKIQNSHHISKISAWDWAILGYVHRSLEYIFTFLWCQGYLCGNIWEHLCPLLKITFDIWNCLYYLVSKVKNKIVFLEFLLYQIRKLAHFNFVSLLPIIFFQLSWSNLEFWIQIIIISIWLWFFLQ